MPLNIVGKVIKVKAEDHALWKSPSLLRPTLLQYYAARHCLRGHGAQKKMKALGTMMWMISPTWFAMGEKDKKYFWGQK